MAKKTLRRLLEKPFGSEWDQLLRRIRRRDARRFLIFWNRGLGDIALGLFRVVEELRRHVPEAHVTIVSRADLADALTLLQIDDVLVDPALMRNDRREVADVLERLQVPSERFDLILGRPDPTHWFRRAPRIAPRLHWRSDYDALANRFDAPLGHDRSRIDVAVHVNSETGAFYRYRKDWPVESWRALFERVQARRPVRFVLFGHRADGHFADLDCIDLRGKTTLLEMMALIRNRCRVLVAPDSGVLTLTYYLDGDAPLGVVSLWADPRQGIMKQGAPSPNPALRHLPIVAPDERIENITIAQVEAALDEQIDAVVGPASSDRSAGSRVAMQTRQETM